MNPFSALAAMAVFSFTACASTAGVPGHSSTTRPRPRRTETHEALSEAMRGAAFCLPRSTAAVTVHGEFRGPTGAFVVANIESAPDLDERARACVRQTFESARVEPFTTDRWRATRTFGPNGLAVPMRASDGPPPAVTSASSSSSPPPGEGHLDASLVARVVRAHLGEIRHCYEVQLRGHHEFHGRVTTHFTIDENGNPSRVDSRSTMEGGDDAASQGITTCVDDAFRGMTFPRPEGGSVDFTFPFNFAPGD